MYFCIMILFLHLLVLMGSKWEYHFLVLIGSICLWTCHCAAGSTFFGYIQIKADIYKERAHTYAPSKTQIHKHAHARRVHTRPCTRAQPCAGRTHLRSLTLADCQPLQTETRQHHRTPPPMTGVSMAPLRSLWRHRGSSLHFNLPSLLPPQLKHQGLEICFRTEQGFAHRHTHTHTLCLLLNFAKMENGGIRFFSVLKWDTSSTGPHVKSMWGSCITLYWVTPPQCIL